MVKSEPVHLTKGGWFCGLEGLYNTAVLLSSSEELGLLNLWQLQKEKYHGKNTTTVI